MRVLWVAAKHPALILLDHGTITASAQEARVERLETAYSGGRRVRENRSGRELVAAGGGPEAVDDAGDVRHVLYCVR